MRNLSLPVVWEDAEMPEEWERDASMVPDELSQGRYIFWAWSNSSTEQTVMPFGGNTSVWPGINNKSNMILDKDSNGNTGLWDDSIQPPPSMGMLFRDPSTYDLFRQGNVPFKRHMQDAGIAPTANWPAVLYGTLPAFWGHTSEDTGDVLFPNLEVM